MARVGDHPQDNFYRSCRIYLENGSWWFDTREAVQFGPFLHRVAACCSLAVYLAQHVHEDKPRRDRAAQAPGFQDNVAHMVEEVLEVLRQYEDFGQNAAKSWAASRLEDLRDRNVLTAETVGRVRVLEFSLCHPEQTFNFDTLLQYQAR